ncbi:protein DBF4 homolog B [Phaethornis superciliosus]
MAAPGTPRPLRGKSFYLDLPGGREARELAEAIRHLGGVTESFLSKEVTCVVSSNKEAKRDRARTRGEKRSSATPGDAKALSPTPSTSRGNHARPQQRPPDTVLISRGKELLQKAMKNQDTCSGSSILANARLWGVQILHVDEMLAHAQQLLRAISGARKRCQKTEAKCLTPGAKIRTGTLKPPFLKVEDLTRQFRPFHHQFKSFPDLNFLAPKGSSPFEPLKSFSNSCRARGVEGCPKHSKGQKSPQSTAVTVPKKKRGFCECCQETFEELEKHLQSPQHKQFALDDSQYAPVDSVISQLTNSFLELSAKVPWSCLAGDSSGPQAEVTGGMEMLPAELGKERQQPEQSELLTDTQPDADLQPRDRVRSPRKGGRGLPVGVGLMEGSAEGDTGPGVTPGLGWGTRGAASGVGETVTSSSELCKEQMLGSLSQPPAPLLTSRKRQLPSGHGTQLGKKPRLELGGSLSPNEQTNPVGGGMGEQGSGQASELGLPGVVEAGSLPPGTELSTRPQSSLGLALCPGGSPGDPASQPRSLGALSVGFDPSEAAAASTVREHGWVQANPSSQGKQLGEENGNTPKNENSPDPESTMSRTSCPPGWLPSPELPVAEARCSCLLCVTAAEKIAPRVPDLPGHSQQLLQPLPHQPQADHTFSRSSSDSDWDVQLLSRLTGIQEGRTQPLDRDLLQRTHVNVRDSGYESQLCSVLKQKSELTWAGKEEKNCWKCCTETKGASFPIFETFFGSWTT